MAGLIELTQEQVDYIKKHHRKLGAGVDGEVYHIKGDLLYKLYISEGNDKTYSPLELSREEALFRALELQNHIKHTNLPQNIITMNDKVIGCTYKKYNTILGIYAASIFPISVRKNICSKLLFKMQELYENYIYLVTLAQKNEKSPLSRKESNILLSYSLEPLIIDLDGNSAHYTTEFSRSHYIASLISISKMIFEILLNMDLPFEYLDENKEEFYELATRVGIPLDVIDRFYGYNYVDIDALNKVLKR